MKSELVLLISGLIHCVFSNGIVSAKNPWDIQLPSNKLGIFLTTMVRVERKYHHGTEMWNFNRRYLDRETEETIQIMCAESLKEDAKIGMWTNCTTNLHTLTAALHFDTPEERDQNITYRAVVIKPFVNSEGQNCIFVDKPRKLFYLSVISFLFRYSDVEFDEKPFTKLDKFFPHAFRFFQDLINTDLIYQYEPEDFVLRPQGYMCLLSIVREESVEDIEKICSFKCDDLPKKPNSKIEL